jgi:class 3 adenylate cyclase/tetratricopeptide (TPR) repeat protein
VPVCASCGQDNPDGFKFCGNCGAALADATPRGREVRKTVTIVFSDVTGSTALGERLDPEATKRLMRRYYDAMSAAVERHGGTVEKFIGDAVMAVFGIPTLHEDDALRAVRAAADMRDALSALNDELERDFGVRIQARTGVNTGEVVAGEGQTLAVGDAVNTAARLEQAAAPGEILLGDSTFRLVRDAVRAEAASAVTAKGKTDPLTAHRLLDVVAGAEAFTRRLDAPMIGRENELSQLSHAFERAVRERTPYLFTILGSAGIGKSRLVLEFLDRADGEATILLGRCLPYGEGITYWPLMEVLRRLDDVEATELLDRITRESAGVAEEIAWATRTLFERAARRQPLVVVLDDLHWAEPTFLDLVEHVADWSREAPMLLVAVARPELIDARPTWAGGKLNATSILLEALSEDESERLIDALLADPRFTSGVRRRVVEAAEGNPLFVEQMLAMASEDGANGDLAVPPTIQALLAARLERLPAAERATVERAAVVGKEFSLAEVRELTPPAERPTTADCVLALVRKELVRPAQAAEGDDVFRFRHLLIRDAAYEAMSKEARSELHERYADQLDERWGARAAEFDEIVGYHLEQAYGFRAELGPLNEAGAALRERAAQRVAAVAQRALGRGDLHAAEALFDRAIALFGPDDPRVGELVCDLSIVIRDRGRLDEAEAALTGVLDEHADADPVLRARAELLRTYVRALHGSPQTAAYETAERVTRLLEERGAEPQLAEAYSLLGIFRSWQGRMEAGRQAYERAAELAKRHGNARVLTQNARWWSANALWGPTTVEDSLDLCRRLRSETDSRLMIAAVTYLEGAFILMRDGPGKAPLEQVTEAAGVLEELGQVVSRESLRMAVAIAYLFIGDLRGAEEELRPARTVLARLGERGFLSTVSALLALALCGQGRYDEAAPLAAESEAVGAADDLTTQAASRAARAQILAARGEDDAAIAVGREGLAVVADTDMTSDQVTALLGLGSTYALLGRLEEARETLEEAGRLLANKGVPLGVAYVQRLVAEL